MKLLSKVLVCSLIILLSSLTGFFTVALVHGEGHGLLGADSSIGVEHGIEVEEVDREIGVDTWQRYRAVLEFNRDPVQFVLDERLNYYSLRGLFDNQLRLVTTYEAYTWFKLQVNKGWRRRVQRDNPGLDYNEFRLQTSISLEDEDIKSINLSHLYLNRIQTNREDSNYVHNDYRVELESACIVLDKHNIFFRYQDRRYPENESRDYGETFIRYTGTYSIGWPQIFFILDKNTKDFISSDRYYDSKTHSTTLSLRGRPIKGSYFRTDVEHFIRNVIGNELNDYVRNTVFFRFRYPLTDICQIILYGRNRTQEYVNQPASVSSGDYWIRDGSIDLSYEIFEGVTVSLGYELEYRIYNKRPDRDSNIYVYNLGLDYASAVSGLSLTFEKEINDLLVSGETSVCNTAGMGFRYEVDSNLLFELIYTQIDGQTLTNTVKGRLLYEF